MPSTSVSLGNSNAAAILKSTENIDDDDGEAHSFTDQRLFSFAWQVAKGMVIILFLRFFVQDFYVSVDSW